VFEDEGYSGATLIRPGVEKFVTWRQRIDRSVLVHSPDRLSRKYAYQVLLMEEFARSNVGTLFIKAPQTTECALQFFGKPAPLTNALGPPNFPVRAWRRPPMRCGLHAPKRATFASPLDGSAAFLACEPARQPLPA
jgi:hypothetical protein